LKLKIAIVHTFFDEAGGGERLALEMYRALRDLGNKTDLFTAHVDKRAWDILTSGVEDPPTPIQLGEPLPSILLRRTGRFVRLRRLYTITHLMDREKWLRKDYDLVIETQTNVPVPWADVSYIHLPAIIDFMAIQGKAGGLRKLYDWLVIREVEKISDTTKPMLTNSTYTADHILKLYGNSKVYIVYPPVNIEELLPLGGERGKIVLTVSRISPEKGLTSIAEIARLVPEAEFYLVGSTSIYSGPVLRAVEERAKGLRNFHLETDVPRRRILELMSKASIYLHPAIAEHFGISIAEATAAGLVPVVYRDGGGWTDIASRVDSSLGYTNVDDAAHIIKSLLNDTERLKVLSTRARGVAKGFSYDTFKERLRKVINYIASKS